MKTLFLDSTLSFITKYKNYTDEEVTELRYGLEGIYLTITKLVIVFALAIILNIFKQVVSLLILFNIIRYFGFGVHAGKSSECLITSLILFILIPFIFLNLTINKNILIILSIVSIISFLPFAPADTIKRPMRNKRKRLVRKILTIITGVIFLICGILINRYSIYTLFFLAIIIQAIVVNPLTYKIMGQPYNNYKNM